MRVHRTTLAALRGALILGLGSLLAAGCGGDDGEVCFDRSGEAAEVLKLATDAVLLAPDEGGYALAWTTEEALWVLQLDATGAPVGEPVPLSTPQGELLDIEPAGGVYGLLWIVDAAFGGRRLLFELVDPRGGASASVELDRNEIPDEIYSGDLAWTGERFGAIWGIEEDIDVNAYFALVDPDGSLEPPVAVRGAGTWLGLGARLVWNGETFGAGLVSTVQGANWNYQEFTVFSSDGTQAADSIIVDEGEGVSPPRPMWTGEEWILPVGTDVKSDGYAGGLLLATRLGGYAQPIDHVSLVGDLEEPVSSVGGAWSASGGVIAWLSAGEAHLTPVDASLTVTGCSVTTPVSPEARILDVAMTDSEVRVLLADPEAVALSSWRGALP
ncbi:hypothetical protein [Sorangium sp. So ce861]|uniref:hypothetical protein n=1 Tax=Sorangium sp. So ce861 TaxID=3133323 RepID=UPI003F631F72